MVNLSYVTLNVNIGENFWKTTTFASAFVIASYAGYKFLKRNAHIDDITNKCVLITGCDSGFGRALAKQLDVLGCRVFATCLTSQGAESLDEETSDRLKTVHLDVTSSGSISAALEYVKNNIPEGTIYL